MAAWVRPANAVNGDGARAVGAAAGVAPREGGVRSSSWRGAAAGKGRRGAPPGESGSSP